VYFTRRIKKDGSLYFGPYFPSSLARRILHFVHKRFLVPSCTVDLTRSHPRPCLQYYIKRCLGPCVAGLTTDERYAEAARDVRLFLEGRRHDLIKSLEERMAAAAEKELFRTGGRLPRFVADAGRHRRAAAHRRGAGDDTDVLAYTPNRRSWLRTFFTCAAGVLWIAANSIGKNWKNLIRRSSCLLF